MHSSPIQPKNLNEQVVEALGKRIISGFYQQQQQLPIEAKLCAEYGVSRPVMREASKIMMAKGLINSKPRVGTIVRAKKYWNLLDAEVLSWTIQLMPENEFLDMLFDVRMAMEPYAAELAAKNATADDIQKLTAAFQDMESAMSPAQLVEPDIRFHQAIMDATHNELFSYIGQTLHNALAQSIQLTSRHPDTHELSLPRHKIIFIAIKESDHIAAREATISLLTDSRHDYDLLEHRREK